MNKKSKKLTISKESIRNLIAGDLQQVGGGFSCGALSACDCSTSGTTNTETIYCTKPQY